MKVQWLLKQFSELTAKELYVCLQARLDVFVMEQNCIYRDLDEKDFHAYHLMGFSEDLNELVAYARLLPAGISYEEPSIGRVLTPKKYRNHGFGKVLMSEALLQIKHLFPHQNVRISAQVYLLEFYHSLGFKSVGEIYDEDGLPHIEMLKEDNPT